MNPNKDFEVFNEDIEFKMREIGEIISGVLPAGWGFNLLVFSFGAGGSMFYISNAERQSMIDAMNEFIKKQEGK